MISSQRKPSRILLLASGILNLFIGIAFASSSFKRLPNLGVASWSEAAKWYGLLGCGIACVVLGCAMLYRYFFPHHVSAKILAKKMAAEVRRELMIQLFEEIPLQESPILMSEMVSETEYLIQARLPELRAAYRWPASESMKSHAEKMAKELLAQYSPEKKRKLAEAFYRRNWGRDRNLAVLALAVAVACFLFMAFHFDLL